MIKKFNSFISESTHYINIEILKDISYHSYIIEDEGFKIVYFVTFLETGVDKPYTYALGSSYDINKQIISLEHYHSDLKLKRVSLEIVNDIPRTIPFNKVFDELEKNDTFNHMVELFRTLLPKYKISRSEQNKPPYIYFDII
jgi:hypothetical protein